MNRNFWSADFSETAMNNNALINGAKRLGIPKLFKWSFRQLWLRVTQVTAWRLGKKTKQDVGSSQIGFSISNFLAVR